MKKKTIFLLLALLNISVSFAKTITVSNNPNSPGQYKRLDSAILAAAAGDVLLVSGSLTDYNTAGTFGGALTINKPLTIYGQGYDPRKDEALSSYISVLHITLAGSGSSISGFTLGTIYEDQGTHDIVVSRCKINGFGYSYGGNGGNGIYGNNQMFMDNIMFGPIILTGSIGDIIIQNNLIAGSISGPATTTNVIINNNYFSNSIYGNVNYPNAIIRLSNALVYNNIFYYKSTTVLPVSYVGSAVNNCVFNNNIYFNSVSTNPLAVGVNNNSGSNNIPLNPVFANIDLTTAGAITRLDNFNLQPGSPGINAGTDGKNIGPHGGSSPIQYPYSGNPAIPQMDSLSIFNPVIPPNGTLNVKFAAHSNN